MGECWWRCSIILFFLNCNPAPVTCLLVTHWSPLFFSGDCLQATAPHTMQNYFTPTALSWPIRERLMGVCRPRYLAATGSSAGDGETTALWRRRWEGWKKKSKQRMLSAASPLWSRLIRSQWSELTDTVVPLWGTYSPFVSAAAAAAAAEPTQSGTPVCTQHCVAFSMSDSRVGITRWSLRQPPSKLSPNCFHGGFLLPWLVDFFFF